MILPDKNIKLKYSILNCGSEIVKLLDEPKTITALWEKSKQNDCFSGFDKFILSMDFLYMINAIEMVDGMIRRCKS